MIEIASDCFPGLIGINRHLLTKGNLFVRNRGRIEGGIVVEVLREDRLHRKRN